MKKTVFFLAMVLMSAGCKGNEGKSGQLSVAGMEQVAAKADVGNAEANGADGAAAVEQQALDVSKLPKTAQRMDSRDQVTVYVNVEQAPNEDDPAGVYSVWLVDEQKGSVQKICQTNPMGKPRWEQMKGRDANAVDVPLDEIAAAEKAYLAPGGMVIVEGCPDARNVWTYIIDPMRRTAKQFPSTEGVVSVEWADEEIVLSSYTYDIEEGRYSYTRAYTIEGNFLRVVDEKVEE